MFSVAVTMFMIYWIRGWCVSLYGCKWTQMGDKLREENNALLKRKNMRNYVEKKKQKRIWESRSSTDFSWQRERVKKNKNNPSFTFFLENASSVNEISTVYVWHFFCLLDSLQLSWSFLCTKWKSYRVYDNVFYLMYIFENMSLLFIDKH